MMVLRSCANRMEVGIQSTDIPEPCLNQVGGGEL